MGPFSKDVSGLIAGTQYYVRAYATNSEGTSLGVRKMNKTIGFSDGDGNVYNSVVIGSQEWLTENLKTTKYLNGDLISKTANPTVWYNTNQGIFYDVSRSAGYGHLYDAIAVKDPRKLCPVGTHIPSNIEWQTLFESLGDSVQAAVKLKTTNGWNIDSIDFNGTNISGFSALPAGSFFSADSLNSVSERYNNSKSGTAFWAQASGSEFHDGLGYLILTRYVSIAGQSFRSYLKVGLSVRCIKD